MLKSIEATGKTIDLAIQAGLETLHMDRDSVSVEVVAQPRSGFFGIGSSPAKVKLSYEVADPVQDPAPVVKKETAPAAPAAKKQAAPAGPAKEEHTEKPVRPAKQAVSSVPATKEPEKHIPADETVTVSAPVFTPAPAGTVEAKIETFLKGLLEHMGSDAVPVATKVSDDTYSVELQGNNLGMLIGRHGDTLDAIQHITNYSINHGQNKRVRVNVDAENYRQKREESLEHLAKKVAAKVVRSHRNITLEPMNAYERHVIHAALQDYPDVTTYSTGTEPGRRIVVAYSKYRSVPEESK